MRGSSGGIANNGVVMPLVKISFKKITDGTSNTLMYGELSWKVDNVSRDSYGPQSFEPWIVGSTSKDNNARGAAGYVQGAKNVRYPINERPLVDENNTPQSTLTDVSLGSNHPGGTHFGMSDGSAHFVTDNTPVEILWAMASRASGETFDAPN